MTRSILAILGSCLALQAPLAVTDIPVAQRGTSSSEFEVQPLFHKEHSKELLETDSVNEEVSAEEVSKFILKRTRELLPVPFRGQSRRIAQALIESANKHQMDPLFLMAVIEQESTFNPKARGGAGEIGLMQIKPSTAAFILSRQSKVSVKISRVEKMLLDPVANIRFGAAYLAQLRASFKGQGHHYITAYNMGSARLREKLKEGVQPRIYSSKVLARYVAFSGGLSTHASQPVAASRNPITKTLGL